MLILSLGAGQHEVIAENLSTAVVADLSSLVKSLKDDRRKVGIILSSVLRIWIRGSRSAGSICFLDLPDPNPDPLVRDTDTDPSIVKQK
jgi:hypothetical protein